MYSGVASLAWYRFSKYLAMCSLLLSGSVICSPSSFIVSYSGMWFDFRILCLAFQKAWDFGPPSFIMFLNVFSIFSFSSCSIIVLNASCVLCIIHCFVVYCFVCALWPLQTLFVLFFSFLALFTSFELFFFIEVFTTFFPIVFVRACFMAIYSSSYVVFCVCVLFLYVFVVQLQFFFCSFYPYGVFSCLYMYCCVPYHCDCVVVCLLTSFYCSVSLPIVLILYRVYTFFVYCYV